MHSWLFRHRHGLRTLYGLKPVLPAPGQLVQPQSGPVDYPEDLDRSDLFESEDAGESVPQKKPRVPMYQLPVVTLKPFPRPRRAS